ncbi:50S ribosomal protein L29 [ANME-1 cluster archaeon ex4572_4]|nr:50S ribosomal protein L29 [Methanophagales archaeon]OYT66487.1 MAG: 50S ribosomal protein L29 [ANME-1 cluster archaeon ex4572_4]PXF50420.1 MAG: 50S ribosomal protein L29 [Methanophagales archaeon]HDN68095.1 50S ribosomal protein L29 [Methanomicrobia archaeon]
MSIFRIDEIRKMSGKERREELESLETDLMRERGVIATGGAPDNPGRIREVKRAIARIKTVEREEAREQEEAAARTAAAGRENERVK